jgi:hypothetical protein
MNNVREEDNAVDDHQHADEYYEKVDKAETESVDDDHDHHGEHNSTAINNTIITTRNQKGMMSQHKNENSHFNIEKGIMSQNENKNEYNKHVVVELELEHEHETTTTRTTTTRTRTATTIATNKNESNDNDDQDETNSESNIDVEKEEEETPSIASSTTTTSTTITAEVESESKPVAAAAVGSVVAVSEAVSESESVGEVTATTTLSSASAPAPAPALVAVDNDEKEEVVVAVVQVEEKQIVEQRNKQEKEEQQQKQQTEEKIIIITKTNTTVKKKKTLKNQKGIEIYFQDFMDLQTRLVLLPLHDDECIGATIASYMTSTVSTNGHDGDDHMDNGNEPSTMNLTGYILTGIQGVQQSTKTNNEEENEKENVNCMDQDYTYILSAIKDAPTPIVLRFQDPKEIELEQEQKQKEVEEQEQQPPLEGYDAVENGKEVLKLLSTQQKEGNNAVVPKKSKLFEPHNDDNHHRQSHLNSESTDYDMKHNDSKKIKVMQGRFQRWGSHLAAEATKAVIAGKEIAREKVNERYVTPEQEQPQQSPLQPPLQPSLQPAQQPHQQPTQPQPPQQPPQQPQQQPQQQLLLPQQQPQQQPQQPPPQQQLLLPQAPEIQEQQQVSSSEIKELKEINKTLSYTSLTSGGGNITDENTLNESKDENKDMNKEPCGLFLQTSFGQCLPLKKSLYKQSSKQSKSKRGYNTRVEETGKNSNGGGAMNLFKKAPPIISNTSVLVIRKCSRNACPTLGYKYQWYKTSLPQHVYVKNDCDENKQCTWKMLKGANGVMIIPSATDVGYRLKCEVTIDTAHEEFQQKDDIMNDSRLPQSSTIIDCELPFVIENDFTLFSAAMKTFVPLPNGAPGVKVSSFGNIIGRDEFDGLQIRINLHYVQDNGIQGGFYMTLSGNTEVRRHLLKDLFFECCFFSNS